VLRPAGSGGLVVKARQPRPRLLDLKPPRPATPPLADAACASTPAGADAVKAFNWVMPGLEPKVSYAKSSNKTLAVRIKAAWKNTTEFCVDIPDATPGPCKTIEALCGPGGCVATVVTQGINPRGGLAAVRCKVVQAVPLKTGERAQGSRGGAVGGMGWGGRRGEIAATAGARA
jgi:hypothetical protein